jgi:hypothetical protein
VKKRPVFGVPEFQEKAGRAAGEILNEGRLLITCDTFTQSHLFPHLLPLALSMNQQDAGVLRSEDGRRVGSRGRSLLLEIFIHDPYSPVTAFPSGRRPFPPGGVLFSC